MLTSKIYLSVSVFEKYEILETNALKIFCIMNLINNVLYVNLTNMLSHTLTASSQFLIATQTPKPHITLVIYTNNLAVSSLPILEEIGVLFLIE